ncbi:MAG: B12-binding domain-containing radical SAM protein, partial [Candidatus Eremiobacterota bacterium]
MKTILFILPALQEVLSAKFRQIKYSLFPPLSLLTLAGLVSPDKYNLIVRDEHVENIFIDEPV